jgi:hypothetical protein
VARGAGEGGRIVSAPAELAALEAAEIAYLLASGWTRSEGGGLWRDPLDPKHSHIDRVASAKQRGRDTAADNARTKGGAT